MDNKNAMVGRRQELAQLQEIISSPKAELVAVYGRRRIGKTFLIDKMFDAKYDFYTTGIYEGTRKEQLTYFATQLGIDFQLVDAVPTEPLDITMDEVISL